MRTSLPTLASFSRRDAPRTSSSDPGLVKGVKVEDGRGPRTSRVVPAARRPRRARRRTPSSRPSPSPADFATWSTNVCATTRSMRGSRRTTCKQAVECLGGIAAARQRSIRQVHESAESSRGRTCCATADGGACARRCSRSATGRWASGKRSVTCPRNQGAALLVAPNTECAVSVAEIGAPKGEGRAGRDLRRRRLRACPQSRAYVRARLWARFPRVLESRRCRRRVALQSEL